LAANFFSTPFVVTVGLYKLTPNYSIDQDSFNNFLNPNEVLPFEHISTLKNVHVIQPGFLSPFNF
jgi:translation initiation factor eIF-2B subunit beta